jgi:enoyl-CoA hydratase/carnithine racemase
MNDPATRNALGNPLAGACAEVDRFEKDPELKVLVITGATHRSLLAQTFVASIKGFASVTRRLRRRTRRPSLGRTGSRLYDERDQRRVAQESS